MIRNVKEALRLTMLSLDDVHDALEALDDAVNVGSTDAVVKHHVEHVSDRNTVYRHDMAELERATS